MLKLVSFHIQAHLNAFLQILEYFSQICLGPLARESPCITYVFMYRKYNAGENKEKLTHFLTSWRM